MKRVIIESPFAGDVKRNVEYAKKCLKHSLDLGEAPIASHLLYTQVLDDNIDVERHNGIMAGLAWLRVADVHVFYVDYGMSNGMKAAMSYSKSVGIRIVKRKIL